MKHFYTYPHELSRLNQKLMQESALVEDRIRKATRLIDSYDYDIAQKIIAMDYEIDELEVEIEEDCLKILALHQPVASDLRFIIAVIKINNELERIADMAVAIALRTDNIARHKHEGAAPYDFSSMSEKVIMMLKNAVDALVNKDAALARSIFLDDDMVDDHRDRCYDEIKKQITEHPENPAYYINTYLLARHLERIADRAVNIAEEVVYLVEGNITRFKTD